MVSASPSNTGMTSKFTWKPPIKGRRRESSKEDLSKEPSTGEKNLYLVSEGSEDVIGLDAATKLLSHSRKRSNSSGDGTMEGDEDSFEDDEGDSEGDSGSSSTTTTANLPEKRQRNVIHSYECERCGKIYKHRNCLVKHGWEHHDAWGMTKKYCSTKHQQVQMLEAAHVLVEMTRICSPTMPHAFKFSGFATLPKHPIAPLHHPQLPRLSPTMAGRPMPPQGNYPSVKSSAIWYGDRLICL